MQTKKQTALKDVHDSRDIARVGLIYIRKTKKTLKLIL